MTLAVVAGLILTLGWGIAFARRTEEAYTPFNLTKRSTEAIPSQAAPARELPADAVIRLHVKGNSNDAGDQDVKLKVRDALMERFGGTLAAVTDVRRADDYLRGVIPEIEKAATACLKENGYSYGAKAAIRLTEFPDKTYTFADGRELYMPAGKYTALVVDLGKGQGDNWWCLMYPPLCYFDLVQRAVILEQGVPGTTGSTPARPAGVVVVDEASAKDVPIEIRSLILDALKAGVARITGYFARTAVQGSQSAQDAR